MPASGTTVLINPIANKETSGSPTLKSTWTHIILACLIVSKLRNMPTAIVIRVLSAWWVLRPRAYLMSGHMQRGHIPKIMHAVYTAKRIHHKNYARGLRFIVLYFSLALVDCTDVIQRYCTATSIIIWLSWRQRIFTWIDITTPHQTKTKQNPVHILWSILYYADHCRLALSWHYVHFRSAQA